MLGQRSTGIILGDTESRVLRPLRVANQGRRQSRGRRLDRARLQPTQAPLIARYDLPRRVREPTHSDGTSRLTVCPPNGVKPSERVLRFEAIVHNTAELRCGRMIEKFPDIVTQLAGIAER